MIGVNQLVLNKATIKLIIQEWLDRVMPGNDQIVYEFRRSTIAGGPDTFVVTLTDGEEDVE